MIQLGKRLLSMLLCLALTLSVAPAMAGLDDLDATIGEWLNTGLPLGASVTMQLKKWMPFDDNVIERFNGVLGSAALHLWLADGEAQRATAAQLDLGESDLFSLAETEAYGQYALSTILLPNLTLTSDTVSPMTLLTASKPVAYLADSPEVEDIEEPFTLLGALGEIASQAYPALAEKVKADVARKKANYNIKGIAAGKYSFVLKLEDEQLSAYQPLVAAALSCGMNASYRETLSQITLSKGFTVAVYQDKNEADIALYMKGNFKTADGTTYKLRYQWAFLDQGLERKDQYTFETSKSGATDSRVISATHERTLRSDTLKLKSSATCTLKRGLSVDLYTVKLNVKGAAEGPNRGLTGTASTNRRHEKSGDQHYTLTTFEPKLTLVAGLSYVYPEGDCRVTVEKDKRAVTDLVLTFGDIASEEFAAVAAGGDPARLTALTDTEAQAMAALQPTATPEPTPEPPKSSLAQNNDELTLPDSTIAPKGEPTGIPPYEMPASPTRLAFDTLAAEAREPYLQWAAQNMAVRLLLCMLTLPQESQQLLYDALTSEDLQQVSELFGNIQP